MINEKWMDTAISRLPYTSKIYSAEGEKECDIKE